MQRKTAKNSTSKEAVRFLKAERCVYRALPRCGPGDCGRREALGPSWGEVNSCGPWSRAGPRSMIRGLIPLTAFDGTEMDAESRLFVRVPRWEARLFEPPSIDEDYYLTIERRSVPGDIANRTARQEGRRGGPHVAAARPSDTREAAISRISPGRLGPEEPEFQAEALVSCGKLLVPSAQVPIKINYTKLHGGFARHRRGKRPAGVADRQGRDGRSSHRSVSEEHGRRLEICGGSVIAIPRGMIAYG